MKIVFAVGSVKLVNGDNSLDVDSPSLTVECLPEEVSKLVDSIVQTISKAIDHSGKVLDLNRMLLGVGSSKGDLN